MDYRDAWSDCATISTFLTLDDISKAWRQLAVPDGHETPVLNAIAASKKRGYKRLCMPLTTQKWKERWSKMCLLPTKSSDQDKESAAKAAELWRLNPAFQRDEVTITRLGGPCLHMLSFFVSSSHRQFMNSFQMRQRVSS